MMTLVATGIMDWTADLLGLSTDQLERGLTLALWIGLAFAALHLVTMLVTRWGDTNASWKSLIFSLLFHISCVSGLAALQSQVSGIEKEAPPKPEPRVQIQMQAEQEPVQLTDTGNTPVWEKPPTTTDTELARLDPQPLDLQQLEGPERKPEPVTRPDIDIPDLPTDTERETVVPEAEMRGQNQDLQAAAIPLKIEAPTAESQAEVDLGAARPDRQTVDRPGFRPEAVERQPERGAIDRIRPEFNSADDPVALNTPRSSPEASIRRADETSDNIPREGPAPSPVKADDIGTLAESQPEESGGDSPTVARITRQVRGPVEPREEGTLERLRPERLPRRPGPQIDREVVVRESIPIDRPTRGDRPEVVRPNFDPLRIRPRSSIPPTYQQRLAKDRKETVLKFGGTEESERAVDLSLQWLARHQSPAGNWDGDRYGSGRVKVDEQGVDRRNAGRNADTGLTALALLAFLAKGQTHEFGQYTPTVRKGLEWLISQQRNDGYLGGNATHYAQMYCHGMATYALAEAYGMQEDGASPGRLELRAPLERAIRYTISQQNTSDGGWRYVKGQQGDMSMFGWQLMALKSAEIAGLEIPAEVRSQMIAFLKERSLGDDKGLAAYRSGLEPTEVMTAEALFCKQMLGIRRTNKASIEAVRYLQQRLPNRRNYNLYYWYYGTLAMFNYGGEPWRQWNESLRPLLEADQIKTGENAGSWDPKGVWGQYGGRVYSTALSALCLEVYARWLPLYDKGVLYDIE